MPEAGPPRGEADAARCLLLAHPPSVCSRLQRPPGLPRPSLGPERLVCSGCISGSSRVHSQDKSGVGHSSPQLRRTATSLKEGPRAGAASSPVCLSPSGPGGGNSRPPRPTAQACPAPQGFHDGPRPSYRAAFTALLKLPEGVCTQSLDPGLIDRPWNFSTWSWLETECFLL